MKIIVCTGDSHTWGQGADGVAESLESWIECGDTRAIPFRIPSYVNLLRRYLNTQDEELCAQQIAETGEGCIHDGCFCLDESLHLLVNAAMIRIHFRRQSTPSVATVLLDDVPQTTFSLQGEQTEYSFYGIHKTTLHCEEGIHKLTVRCEKGEVRIYRIELYRGDYAVVNSGVGSCSTKRYMEEFWQQCVTDCRPDIVLAEAHTINDWLTRCSPETYENNLSAYLQKLKETRTVPILMTVAPIAGPQSEPCSPYCYRDLVEASRRAAQKERVELCDANRAVATLLEGLSEEEQLKAFFADRWHPNNRGHEVYARCAEKAIKRITC